MRGPRSICRMCIAPTSSRSRRPRLRLPSRFTMSGTFAWPSAAPLRIRRSTPRPRARFSSFPGKTEEQPRGQTRLLFCFALVAVLRIRGLVRLRVRMLCKLVEGNRYRLLQLWIMPLGYRLRILFDHHIRIYAMVLHIPLAFGREERDRRGGDRTAVHQHRDVADADEPSPCALAHQRAQVVVLEQDRKSTRLN